ncbi:CbiQ family ECF transporter T component [Kineococcus siccus]|uniref:CbiQ family ECF transporter T component n=1 Tax=Kineococcus siccus TaxID=2696567 RepID=UPI001412EB14
MRLVVEPRAHRGLRGRPRGLDASAPLLGRQPDQGQTGLARAGAPGAGSLAALAVLLVGGALLAVAAGLGVRYLAGQLRRLWVVLLLLAAVQLLSRGPLQAAAVVAALVACVWAAALVTGTTPVPVLLDAVVRGLRPLRRVGVDPDRVGLALLLAVTSIPVVAGLLDDSRAAAAARGLGRDPRAVLVPTVLRTVAHAHAVSEALAARGLVDD